MPDRPADVVQNRAGETLSGRAEGDGGVQTRPAALGLAVQVDGQIEFGNIHSVGGCRAAMPLAVSTRAR